MTKWLALFNNKIAENLSNFPSKTARYRSPALNDVAEHYANIKPCSDCAAIAPHGYEELTLELGNKAMTLFSEQSAGETRQITDLVIEVQRGSDGLIALLEQVGPESEESRLKSAMLNRLEGIEATLRELTTLCRETLS
jgi:hypothetical protein